MTVAIAGWSCVGCATVTVTRHQSDPIIVDVTRRSRQVSESPELRASGELVATDLVVTVEEYHRCTIEEVTRRRIETRTVRSPASGVSDRYQIGVQLGLGGALAVVGAGLLITDGDCLVSSRDSGDNVNFCSTLGRSSELIAALLVINGLRDMYRLRDDLDSTLRESTEQMGVEPCHERPIANEVVTLRVGGMTRRVRTSDKGVARLSLGPVGPDELDSAIMISARGLDRSVEMPSGFATEAMFALQQKSGTAANIELAASCETAMRYAEQSDRDEAPSMWDLAESRCGVLWSSALKSRRDRAILSSANTEFRAAIARNDWSAAARLLDEVPALTGGLRSDQRLRVTLSDAVAVAAWEIKSSKAYGVTPRSTLCRARTLFILVYGAPAWTTMVLEIGKRASRLDGSDPDLMRRQLDRICVAG